jgi:hypothetical protein
MALQHLRSSTADKRPTPGAMSDGQLALNTNLVSPGLFFKDSNGDTVKIGPVHVGTTAPNVSPAVGGEAGNSLGEAWLDTTAANPILKVFNGSAFVAVQPVGTGTVVSTTDTGTVTSTMILDGTILNADINASAAIVDTKLDTIATAGKVSGTAITSGNISTSGSFTSTSTVTGTNLIPTGSGVPTNGIYLPAANSVAVSTGGAPRITIDSSGRLLAGTATARSAFGITSNIQGEGTDYDGGSINLIVNNNSGAGNSSFINLCRSRGTANGSNTVVQADDSLGAIAWCGADGSGLTSSAATIRAFVDGTPDVNDMPGRLVFSTTVAGGSSPSERLRITSAGLVGIGTSLPSSDGPLTLSNSATTPTIFFERESTNFNGAIQCSAYGTITFYNGADSSVVSGLTPRMTIDGQYGRVGIGTTSPGSLLHLSAADSTSFNSADFDQTYNFLRIVNTTHDKAVGIYFGVGNNGEAAITAAETTDGETALVFGTRGGGTRSERARLDHAGRLLVGTTSDTGSLSNTAPVIAGLFKSFDDAATFTTGVAQTLFTVPNTDATYIITLRRGAVGDALNYQAVSILSANATVGGSVTTVLTALKTAGNVSISISGTNLQGTQTSGGAASLQWVVTRVG